MEPQNQTPTLPEVPPVGTSAQDSETLQKGLTDRTKALEAVGKTKENLGQVAAGHEVHTDASGVVMTDREVGEVRANGTQEDIRV